jgi:DNA-binding Lrp family transcriptional regulator
MKKADREIFKFIIAYYIDYAKFPTLAEIGQNFHFSRERARQRLLRIEGEGLIKKIPGKIRNFELTAKALNYFKKKL